MGFAFGEPLSPSGGTGEDRCPLRPGAIRFAVCVLVHLCLVALLAAPPAIAQEQLLPAPRATPDQPAAEPASPTIDPGLDPREDQEIAQRLRTIYSTVEGLEPVEVRVRAGVVVLTGEVSTQALREQAVRLARNVRGVAEVENRIAIAQDLEGRLTPALKRLQESWNHVLRLLPVLLVGFAIMAGAIVVGRWLARRRSLYRRFSANDFIASLLAQVIQGIVVIGGAALTLLLLDATGLVNTLLGAAGIVGLALGFALRDTVENYIASILLSLRRPFDPEDFVKIENHEGVVARLTSRATVLLTLDGNQVRIPNAAVYKGLIVNFTAQPQRRFTFRLGVAPDEDLGRAQRTAIDALASVDGVLSEPPPTALYESVGDSAVNMVVAGWMDQASHDFLRVRSEAIRVVLTQMGAADVDLPETTVRLRTFPETAEAADATPAITPPPRAGIATTPDHSLNRVVKQERTGKSDLLNQAGPRE
jgi:small conductance mechanosensitive channel